MPKTKKMRNNASSALNEKEMIKMLINHNSDGKNESKELITKHSGMRRTFLKKSKSPHETNESEPKMVSGDDELNGNKPASSGIAPEQNLTISSRFTMNNDLIKIFMKSNFPTRYPSRFENEESECFVLNDSTIDKLNSIQMSPTKLTKTFVKFWNKIITKQDNSTRSVLNHQLTEQEAGYYPCQMKLLFNSPDSYLKKSFCHKLRYTGPGYQLLSSPNRFSKIADRSLLRYEVNQIFQHYSNQNNQYFYIPVEFTSKLSRSMVKSLEICQDTMGCNRINFYCNPQNISDQTAHPLLIIEYKNTIEEEILPPTNFSLVDNYPSKETPSTGPEPENLYKVLTNHPYLAHFLFRNDFNIDNFFARCWHYSRFFCNKLDFGQRMGNMSVISMKDAIFKYLLASSARICIGIKYWILNPEHATYFRCWCGQRLYDAKQEAKLLRKFPIGSAELYNFQQKLLEQESIHSKHSDKKNHMHICACNQTFKDHQSWYGHVLCTKLSDMTKICPIMLFNVSKSSQEGNRYVCKCSDSYSDYDFWSFWLHICGCKILRNFVRKQCHCSKKLIDQNSKKTRIVRKRKRSTISREPNESNKRTLKTSYDNDNPNSENDERDYSLTNFGLTKRMDKSQSVGNTEKDQTDERDWQSGDNINLPLKISNQINSNHMELNILEKQSENN